VPWLGPFVANLSPKKPGFAPGSVHVVDKAALGQVFLRVRLFFLVSNITQWFSILMHHPGDEQYAWPQFRDVVSPHRHEQQQQTVRQGAENLKHKYYPTKQPKIPSPWQRLHCCDSGPWLQSSYVSHDDHEQCRTERRGTKVT
jgi:hypothetical protein